MNHENPLLQWNQDILDVFEFYSFLLLLHTVFPTQNS